MQKEEDEYITMTDAIIRADEITIDLALEGGMEVDERSRFFKTPLMSAIMTSNLKLVTKFVEAGFVARYSFHWDHSYHYSFKTHPMTKPLTAEQT